MMDLEKELDATLQVAAAVVKVSERLAGEVERGEREAAEWKKANGIDQALQAKFFNALSSEDRKRFQDEQEAFNRELAHDIDAAVQRAFPASSKSGGGKRSRSMA